MARLRSIGIGGFFKCLSIAGDIYYDGRRWLSYFIDVLAFGIWFGTIYMLFGIDWSDFPF
jgi:hypothetical protein